MTGAGPVAVGRPASPSGRVVVVGLGPAGPELIDGATTAAIAAHPPALRWARTDRHPGVAALGDHRSFDDVYDQAEDLGAVYPEIVRRLVGLAEQHGSVLYAVPGSPLVAERTVELLRAAATGGTGGLAVELHPALSFLDLAWDRLGVDPLAVGARLVDGQRFEREAAGQRGPLLVAQCDSLDVLSAVKLSVDGPPPRGVVVLQRLGLPTEAVFEVPWDDLDRSVRPDHLTSIWVPHLAAPVAAELVAFAELVATLRARCPWDRAQTHRSLRPFAIEEAYEVADAIDHLDPEGGDGIDELEEELGDLLFQVVFHATLAQEAGWFTLADVARTVHDKLVRRHPHVFPAGEFAVGEPGGQLGAIDSATVVTNWDHIKRAEKGHASALDGVCEALPPRLYAAKMARRAGKVGVTADFGPQEAALDAAEAALLAAVRRLEAQARAVEQR